MARKPTRPRRNKARNARAAKAASAHSSAKAGAKGARRGKPATKSRRSVATRKPAKRITSRSSSKGQRGTRASGRAAAGRRAASGRNPPRRGAARLRRTAAKPAMGAAVAGVRVTGKPGSRYAEILSPDALAFLAELHRRFDATRKRLLAGRAARQARFDAGELPDFLHQTRHIREGDWKIAAIPKDLLDRRVEITDPATGKKYAIGKNPAVLIVRPRGWHLPEQHLTVDGEPIAGALFDFGLYYFHNAEALRAQGTGPYFYLPKLESHIEARLWNDVFLHAQARFGHPKGTIRATVLIETLPAGFEMDEILWELRDHVTGLNAGRWDYIFSFIKKFAKSSKFVLPDRSQVVMGKAFLRAYALLLIKTCHRRGAFAMGGMAAQIPVKNDPAANEAAFAKVRADKEREANDGHDGTWVAHPDLVRIAKQVFDRLMRKPNQLDRLREDVNVTRDMLLEIHEGTKTEAGFRENIRVGVQYIEAWLRGRGAVPIYNLMEDAATAEICRAQIWQWLTYGAALENGVKIDDDFFERALEEEMGRVKREVGPRAYASGRFPDAIGLFRKLSLAEKFEEFLTIPAYPLIV